MGRLRQFFYRLQSLFIRRRIEAGLSEEIQAHLQMQTEANVAAGMTPEEARFAALREFGGVDQIKERYRDERGLPWAEDFLQDMRFAVRQLSKAPGFCAVAVFTIALGIGACTAMFSVANGFLFRPLWLPHPDQLVYVSATDLPRFPIIGTSPGMYEDWRAASSSFQHLAAASWLTFNCTSLGRAQLLRAWAMTSDYLPTLGVQPVIGRNFLKSEETEGRNRVVLLSYGLWKESFGGRADVVNETMRLDDQTYTIVGVLPDARINVFGSKVSLFTPLASSAADRTNYGSYNLVCVGRLKPEISVAAAQSELALISERIAREHPASNKGIGGTVRPLGELMVGGVRLQLLTLLGAVGLLLAIACVNVANLLLARAQVRQREFSIRAALGASRGRIIRQFLCESVLIAVAGGVLGILLAYASMGPLRTFANHFIDTDHITIDRAVLEVICGMMLAAGVGFGLVPALHTSGARATGALKDGGRGSTDGPGQTRARNALVVAEISLALMLLSGTGVLARSMAAMARMDEGFVIGDVYTNALNLSSGKVYESPTQISAFVDSCLQRISALPEIRSCAFSTGVPMGSVNSSFFTTLGDTQKPLASWPLTEMYSVTSGYFSALGIPLVRGRVFSPQDTPGSPFVVLINQEMGRKYFPSVDPIGQKLLLYDFKLKAQTWYQIVGIVGDVRSRGPQNPIGPQVYEALAQNPTPNMVVVLRTKGAAPTLAPEVRDIIHSLDPDLPFDTLYPFYLTVSYAWFPQRFSLVLFTLFSAIALLLAAVGIYGVMAYSVGQRTHEFGIRLALGAQTRGIFRLVLSGGARIAGLGVLIGLLASLGFTRFLHSLLFNTSPTDPLSLAAVAALLAAVTLLACWIPARRATKVDPMVALRAD